MVALDVTKKLHIYHTLYRLNLSFSAIVARCHSLQQAGILKSKDTRLYQGLTQELQCEINEQLLETMRDIEFNDWSRFGKVREGQEKKFRDPKSVHIKTEGYKRRSRKAKPRTPARQ